MKPTKVRTDWCFSCPICGSEWWFTYDEIVVGQNLVCCGKHYGYVKVQNLKLDYKIVSNRKPIKPKKRIPKIAKSAVKVLTGVGYEKVDAIKLVKTAIKKNSTTNLKELVKLAIALKQ